MGLIMPFFILLEKAKAITNHTVCSAHKIIFKLFCIFSAHSYFQLISSKILNGDLLSVLDNLIRLHL